mgnify:CR=1 FL=1
MLDGLGDWVKKNIFWGHGFNIFSLTDFLSWMGGGWGISRGLVMWILYIGLLFVLSEQIPHLFVFTLSWVLGLAPLWLPIGLGYAALSAWIWYIQAYYLAGRDGMLLEVKIPRDIFKSPRAMELALIPMNLSSGETTAINRAWQGGVRPFWSFELASFGGQVHFYIWTWRGFKELVESSIYAYYPEVELVEVEDYAMKFRFDPEIHDCYITEWRRESFRQDHIDKSKTRDGSRELNAYPIKTYIDYELDKDPKEEFKIDPLAEPLEFMSSLRPEDQMWAQIVIRSAGYPSTHVFSGLGFANDMKRHLEIVRKEQRAVRVESLMLFKHESLRTPEDNKNPEFGVYNLNAGSRGASSVVLAELVERMERNANKYLYEVGIRGWIVSTKPVTSHYYNGMRFMWRPMGDPNYSSWLRPRRWHPPFDYPWQDYNNIRWNMAARRFLDAYRRRLFFHSPWRTYESPMILSNEEIATLWHPVSRAVAIPGLDRIPAKKAEPPSNLPK